MIILINTLFFDWLKMNTKKTFIITLILHELKDIFSGEFEIFVHKTNYKTNFFFSWLFLNESFKQTLQLWFFPQRLFSIFFFSTDFTLIIYIYKLKKKKKKKRGFRELHKEKLKDIFIKNYFCMKVKCGSTEIFWSTFRVLYMICISCQVVSKLPVRPYVLVFPK